MRTYNNMGRPRPNLRITKPSWEKGPRPIYPAAPEGAHIYHNTGYVGRTSPHLPWSLTMSGTMCRCPNPDTTKDRVVKIAFGGAVIGLLFALGMKKKIRDGVVIGAGLGAGYGLLKSM